MRSVRTRSATSVSPPLFRMKGVKGFWRLGDWANVVSWLGFNHRRDLTSQLVAAWCCKLPKWPDLEIVDTKRSIDGSGRDEAGCSISWWQSQCECQWTGLVGFGRHSRTEHATLTYSYKASKQRASSSTQSKAKRSKPKQTKANQSEADQITSSTTRVSHGSTEVTFGSGCFALLCFVSDLVKCCS